MHARRLPRGIRNNNPGNIRTSPARWVGETVDDDHAFESFDTPEHGIRAIVRILMTYHRRYGARTIEDYISRWAPASENDTDAYCRRVADALGVEPDSVVDIYHPRVMGELVRAIVRHENGMLYYTDDVFERGVRAGFSGVVAGPGRATS